MANDVATQELFKAIASVQSDDDDDPALPAALEQMRTALQAGADWRAPLGPAGRDAAFFAALSRNAATLRLLLDDAAVPADHATAHRQLIHAAAEFGRVAVIELLVARGVAPDVRIDGGPTPVAMARSWRHGKDAIAPLLALMKAHGCTPLPAKRSDALRDDVVRAALPPITATMSKHGRDMLETLVVGFFAECLGGSIKNFLAVLSESDNGEVARAGLQLVRAVAPAHAKQKTITTTPGSKKRLEVLHHGDIVVEGDANARVLLATGDVHIGGLLAHHEGCMVAVGGSLDVDAIWSEGPLAVGHDLRARTVVVGSYNDYGIDVAGALHAPVLLQLDRHHIAASTMQVGVRYDSRDDVPDDIATELAKALKLSSLKGSTTRR